MLGNTLWTDRYLLSSNGKNFMRIINIPFPRPWASQERAPLELRQELGWQLEQQREQELEPDQRHLVLVYLWWPAEKIIKTFNYFSK